MYFTIKTFYHQKEETTPSHHAYLAKQYTIGNTRNNTSSGSVNVTFERPGGGSTEVWVGTKAHYKTIIIENPAGVNVEFLQATEKGVRL